MKILVTNDDGIFSDGLWKLVGELKQVAEVVVAAPDREQSAVGTAVTLRHPLRVQKVSPRIPGIETYSVEGTPGDSVILALNKLIDTKPDLVVSGINQGLNLGEDVLISGTVGAALQGYLRGFPAVAVSVASADGMYLDNAAGLAALLAGRISANSLPQNIFLNVNLPSLPLADIKDIKITRLGSKSHINTVAEGHDGVRQYYWLMRQRINKGTDSGTDIGAIETGNISITALYVNLYDRPAASTLDSLFNDLLPRLKDSRNHS